MIALIFCKIFRIDSKEWNDLKIPGDPSDSPPSSNVTNTKDAKPSNNGKIYPFSKKRRDK